MQIDIMIRDHSGEFFHFWRKDIYGEPQFGDRYGAKKYKTLAACLARLRALRLDGYSVDVVQMPNV